MKRLKKDECLVTRTVYNDMSSFHRRDFKYPKKGYVEAPDWEPTTECGKGLHGFLNGIGDASLAHLEKENIKWLVIKVQKAEMVELNEKVKFKGGEVIFCGDAAGMTECLASYGVGEGAIAAVVTAGDFGHATAGDNGHATAGDYGHATAGDYGIINIKWWDGKRYRIKIGYIGEDGLNPCVFYKIDDHNFIEVIKEEK